MQVSVAILMLSCALAVSDQPARDFDDDDDDGPLPNLNNLPEKYYEDLLKEIPELPQILVEYSAPRKFHHPYTKYRQGHARTPVEQRKSKRSARKSGRRIYQEYPYDNPSSGSIYWSSNWVGKKNFFMKKKMYPMICCYWCGLNITYFVPTTSLCYDAFESQDGRLRALQRFLRGKCYYVNPVYVNMGNFFWHDFKYMGTFQGWNNFIYGSYIKNPSSSLDQWFKGKWGVDYRLSDGLKRNYFGQYIGGCFKRYLDVGTVYTQRGCKHYWPIKSYGDNSVSHRFRKLEYVLRWKREGCVSSTHASLTPFNRGISLYTRYHVCVCNSRYCNRAVRARVSAAVLIAAVFALTRIFI